MDVMGSKRCVVLTICLASIAGCGEKAAREAAKQEAKEVDLGSIENSAYHNKYFGMSMTIPRDWTIQDRKSTETMMKTGARVVSGDDKHLQAATKAAEQQSVDLLVAFKHPLGSPVLFNPNIICGAECVRHLPGIKRGKDYHFHSKTLLKSSPLAIQFPKEIFSERIDGVEFDVMYTEISSPAGTVKQEQYATIMKGYALLLVIAYTTEEEKSSLKEILDSVTFK